MIMAASLLLGLGRKTPEPESPPAMNATNRASPLSNQDWALLGCDANVIAGEKHGRYSAFERCHPRPRGWQAGIHVLLPSRSGDRDRDVDGQIRRQRLRDGAQSVAHPGAAGEPPL